VRRVNASEITEAVKRLALDAAFRIDERTLAVLEEASARETFPAAREVFKDILENASLACRERRPLCQDTGLAVVWIELGEEVAIEGGSLQVAVDEGVRAAWSEGDLRASVVRDPLDRRNTGDNTPAAVHVDFVPGDRVALRFMAKGGGSENQTRLAMLRPADGREGVVRFVADSIRKGAAYACPPLVLGVGVGGSADKAMWLAKRALFRPVGEPSRDPDTAALEREMLAAADATGVGPMGLGGDVTALAVHVERAPCHIASLPVALCVNCHSHRVRSAEL
jgi:fumarate hydratase subunit alpha